MPNIKEKEFIELSYTGKTADDDTIFDTTEKKVADEHHLHAHDVAPIVICVGKGHLIKGLDKDLVGKEVGKAYKLTVQPEEAYGKKDAKLIQLISTAKFKKQEISPMPGLTVNIDGQQGIVKTVSGGRTLVDFNHPLAGRELAYDYTINKIITETKEKVNAVTKLMLGVEPKKIDIKEGKATITLEHEMPKEVVKEIEKQFIEHIPDLKGINFLHSPSKKEESLKTSTSTQEK